MKLSELISIIGDDNIGVQSIDTCVHSIQTVKHGTRVAFNTDQTFNFDGMEKMGLVVWIDREQAKAALATRPAGGDRHGE